MKRFLCNPLPKQNQPSTLSKAETNHCLNVFRLKNGEEVLAFDGNGNAAYCEIKIHKNNSIDLIWLKNHPPHKTTHKTILELAMIKPKNLEWLVEKITELGVSELHLFISERCNIRPKKIEFEKIHQRLQKISDQSLKQCFRLQSLFISPELKKIESLFPCPEDSYRIIGNTSIANPLQKQKLSSLLYDKNNKIIHNKNIRITIGPEGGFSPNDELLFQNSAQVSFGSLTLKSETAALFASSILSEYFNTLDLDKSPSFQ